MKIVIASKNPVKINSIKQGFRTILNSIDADFLGISVSSEVSDQPMSVEETFQGANNRLKNAIEKYPNADYYCGIEGGLEYYDNDYYAFAWIVIKDKNGITGKARTGSFLLPGKITKLIEQGIELGEADDIVFGQSNSKQKQGSVGILTQGHIDRTEYYSHAVILSLIPFVNKSLF